MASKILFVKIMLYLFHIKCVLGLTVGMLVQTKLKVFPLNRFHQISNMDLTTYKIIHVKLLPSILVNLLFATRDLIVNKHFGCLSGILDKFLNSHSCSSKNGK